MAHAAIAYAKTKRRSRAQAETSSIGPGATNMVTAAALAHVNRLPVPLIPGDVFANRRADPVLQTSVLREAPCDDAGGVVCASSTPRSTSGAS